MKMKNLLAATVVSATFFAPMVASANPLPQSATPLPMASGDLLTGDKRLACEAVLCLSSGERPSECASSLRRYFSIKFKKPHKTISARKDFLKLCPSSNEPNMPKLIDALANGAGRCDATELNRVMMATYRVQECTRISRHSNSCSWVTKSYVRNALPSYCSAYFNHEWTTTGDKIRFVGTEKQGGRWVDVK
ncbi:TrbM/KikA/MpfK family conjugal transfer protein [Alysiella crassa]|uniref:Conjugal transfer protein TrbM n=1 Tax=Alysiella crassa TaxID=153491 RepID=A0A376BLY7_9NEIS|nr:TrbM/KikA/MpfK family conjugal transfer protein [Alysiella crassa]UOP07170.1 conjugal transfer protein TrbM [Alysiella crassa]SSY70668.1 conjugal transfer protein TrbM [Alysiella crassa]